MDTTFTDSMGRTWIMSTLFLTGDYCGSGTIGQANKEAVAAEYGDAFEHLPSWTQCEGYEVAAETKYCVLCEGYGSEGYFLLEGDPFLAEVADYPSLDDDRASELELEGQWEAYEDWGRTELLGGVEWLDLGFDEDEDILPGLGLEDAGDWLLEQLGQDKVDELFEAARDQANEYWVEETGATFWIDMDRIRPTFIELAAELVARERAA